MAVSEARVRAMRTGCRDRRRSAARARYGLRGLAWLGRWPGPTHGAHPRRVVAKDRMGEALEGSEWW